MSQAAYSRRVSIEIDLNALAHNLDCVRSCCPRIKIFSVLKADAYGHGASACATALSRAGTDGFAVVFPGEAVALRDAGIKEPILVLQGPSNDAEVRLLAAKNLWAVVHDVSQLALLESRTDNELLRVWIKVETGMGRLGIARAQVLRTVSRLAELPNVKCVGILSHFACADEPGNTHTQTQIEAFSELGSEIDSHYKSTNGQTSSTQKLVRSLSNSAGVLGWPQASFDWVRPGLMLYGVNPSVQLNSSLPLKPVMQVSAPIIALKSYRRGEGIGYSQSYVCADDMMVGYIAIGYGDGLPRSLSGANVQLNGKPVPIIGRVSMDSIAVDLRGSDATVGDKAIIWGKESPVENLATVAGTISYELLCSVRGKRSYNS